MQYDATLRKSVVRQMQYLPLGDILRRLRDERGLSQAGLAQKIGVSNSMIALYESGARYPSLGTLVKLAKGLGVSTDHLLGLEERRADFLDVSGLTSEEIQSLNAIADNYRKMK